MRNVVFSVKTTYFHKIIIFIFNNLHIRLFRILLSFGYLALYILVKSSFIKNYFQYFFLKDFFRSLAQKNDGIYLGLSNYQILQY